MCTLLILKESLYLVFGGNVSLLVTADDDPPTLKEKGKQRQPYRSEKKALQTLSIMKNKLWLGDCVAGKKMLCKCHGEGEAPH